MVDDIVSFLRSAVSAGVNFSGTLFNATGMWPLVFAAFSIVMISRFILGPILGISVSGSSDVARSPNNSSVRSRNKSVVRSRNKSIASSLNKSKE